MQNDGSQPTGERPLSAAAASGFLWTSGGTAARLVTVLSAQVALGWILSAEDFGIYAIAISVSALLQVFKDGGVRLVLARQHAAEFRANVSNAFWLALFSAAAAGALTVILAPIAASIYDEADVGWMLLLMAALMPFSAYPAVALAKLQVDLRFRRIARIDLLGQVILSGQSVIFAMLGFGPYSFVLPLFGVAAYQTIETYAATRLRPWTEPPSTRGMRQLFGQAKWSISGSAASTLIHQVSFAVLGWVASVRTTGIFFFAYQGTLSLVQPFAAANQQVLLPVFARVSNQRARRNEAVVRGFGLIGLAGCAVGLLLTAVAPPLEDLLFGGRWEDAVPSLQVLAAGAPALILSMFAYSIIASLGDFRPWALYLYARLAFLIGAVLLAGSLAPSDDPLLVAVAVSATNYLALLAETRLLARKLDMRWSPILRVAHGPYLFFGGLAAAIAWGGSLGLAEDAGALGSLAIRTVVYGMAGLVGLLTLFRPVARHGLELVNQLRTGGEG